MINDDTKKALNEIKNYLMSGNPIWDTDKIKEVFDLAISAVDKQIPKPAKITISTKRCATCGRQLSGRGNIHPKRNYCTGCGQAIDWMEEQE